MSLRSPNAPQQPANAVRLQAKANQSTRDHWTYFAPHRARIQELILSPLHATGAGRLCVLGAGNCNDVDLRVLTEEFAEVHHVDIDAAALEAGVRRQPLAEASRLRLHAGVDLTGIADRFGMWEKTPPTIADLEAAARDVLALPAPPIGGPFDVVLSPCLLSQLVGYAGDVLGKDHPRRRDLLLALRTRHLRTLVDLLAPGGLAVLVCDVASSEGVPALGDDRKPDLDDLLNRLSYTGRHFDGLAPDAVEAALKHDPLVGPLLSNVQLVRPWLWRLGPKRTFLVYAACVRRSAGTVLLADRQSGAPWRATYALPLNQRRSRCDSGGAAGRTESGWPGNGTNWAPIR